MLRVKYLAPLLLLVGLVVFFRFFTIEGTQPAIPLSDVTTENIYVINLDRTPERFAPLKKQLEALGLPFTRWSATDGYALALKDSQGRTFTGKDIKEGRAQWELGHAYKIQAPQGELTYHPEHFTLTAGELGCTLSHLGIWHHVASHNIPWALIFEDDAHLIESSFLKGFESVLAHLPADWDVVYLQHPTDDPKKGQLTVLGNGSVKKFRQDNRGVARAHAYMVSHKGAQKLVGYSNPFEFISDGLLSEAINDGVIEAYIHPAALTDLVSTPSTLDEMGRKAP
jgi:glycosyl transferase family 25